MSDDFLNEFDESGEERTELKEDWVVSDNDIPVHDIIYQYTEEPAEIAIDVKHDRALISLFWSSNDNYPCDLVIGDIVRKEGSHYTLVDRAKKKAKVLAKKYEKGDMR